MVSILPLIFALLAILPSTHAMLPETMGDDSSKSLASLPSSPECWLDAMQALNLEAASNPDACQWMTPLQQKMLALELARCHVKDLAQSIFKESSSEFCSPGIYQDHFYECLAQMTPTGETAYTHFLTYIGQLCTRLLREVMMTKFHQASLQLVKVTESAESQLKHLFQRQEELSESWRNREEEAVRLLGSFKKEVYGERERWLMESALIKSQIRAQGAEWLEESEKARNYQLSEMMRQREELIRQREELQELVETVVRTQNSIKPWSLSLDSLYTYLQNAYRMIQWFLNALGECIVIWLLCLPPCLRWLRSYMMGWVILAGAIECVVAIGNDGWLSQDDEEEFVQSVRSLLLLLEVFTFVLGLLVSMCCCCRRNKSNKDSGDDDNEGDMRKNTQQHQSPPSEERREDVLERLQMYEERWKAILHQQSTLAVQPSPVRPQQAPPLLFPPSGSATSHHVYIGPSLYSPEQHAVAVLSPPSEPTSARSRKHDSTTTKERKARQKESPPKEITLPHPRDSITHVHVQTYQHPMEQSPERPVSHVPQENGNGHVSRKRSFSESTAAQSQSTEATGRSPKRMRKENAHSDSS